MKYYVVNHKYGWVSDLYSSFDEAVKVADMLLQQDQNKDAKFEIVAKVAEIKRAPHPVQIKLSQVFYDA